MQPFRIESRFMRQIVPAVLIMLLLFEANNAAGSTITVLNNNDSGIGSLRAAIGIANSGDTIVFDPALSGDTVILTSGEIVIDKNLAILGLDDDSTLISGNNNSRIFNIKAGDTVSIEDMTLAAGMTADSGGAIYSSGTLSVNTCVFRNNSSASGGAVYSSASGSFSSSSCIFQNNSSISGGGGIACIGGCNFNNDIIIGNSGGMGGGIYAQVSLFINGSTISNNSSSADGGGILNFGTGRAIQCIIENNTVHNPASAGGGIFTNSGTFQILNSRIQGNASGSGGGVQNDGKLTIITSAISNNNVSSSGGGIGNDDELTINNSTMSGNASGTNGGAVNNTGILIINNSTVSGNRSDGSGGGIQNFRKATLSRCTVAFNKASVNGGGVNNIDSLLFSNTIIANDTADGQGDELFSNSGKIISLGHNLVRDISPLGGANFTPAASDKLGTSTIPVDPLLGPLQNNGGTTLTHVPQCGSPAIDAGDPAGALITDQRDSARIHGAGIDIGSVENQDDPVEIDAAIVQPIGGNSNGSIDLLLSGGTPPYYVHWNTGDSVLILTGLSEGNYTVTVEDFYGCSATEAFNLTAVQPPNAGFTWLNPSGGIVNFTNTSSNNPTTFDWNFGDGNSSIDQSPTHTYSSNGSYYVCLTVGNSSGTDTFCDSVHVTGLGTSINETEKEKLLLVYPNPTTDYLYVEAAAKSRFIRIYDTYGKLAKTIEIKNAYQAQLIRLDVEDLPSGNYLLTIHDRIGKNKGISRFCLIPVR